MTNLDDLADKQANSLEINESDFLKYMKIKPILDFPSLTRDNYLKLTSNEKTNLINRYCLFMKSDKKKGCKLY